MLITRSKKKIYIPTFATMRNSDLSHFVDTNIHSSSSKNKQGHYSSAQNLKKQPLSQPHRALPSLLPPFPCLSMSTSLNKGGNCGRWEDMCQPPSIRALTLSQQYTFKKIVSFMHWVLSIDTTQEREV